MNFKITDDPELRMPDEGVPLGRSIEIGACSDPNCKLYHLFIVDENKKPLAELQVEKKFFFEFYKSAMSLSLKKMKELTRKKIQ